MDFLNYFTNEKNIFSLSKPAGIVWLCLEVAFLALTIFGLCKVFVKMGQPWWKALIPFYNLYIVCRLCWNKKAFYQILAIFVLSIAIDTALQFVNDGTIAFKILLFAGLILGIATLVYDIILSNKISKAFGHGVWYTLGIIFLLQLFLIILGFEDSKFVLNKSENETALKKQSK